MKIYPHIDSSRHDFYYPWDTERARLMTRLKLETTLRKEHEGKWYLVCFMQDYELENSGEVELAKEMMLMRFIADVYTFSVLGKINPELKSESIFGKDIIYPLDKDQRSEEERLKQLLINK